MTNTAKTNSRKRKSSPSRTPDIKAQSQSNKKLSVHIQSCRSHSTKACIRLSWLNPTTRVCTQLSQQLNRLFSIQKLPKVKSDFKLRIKLTDPCTKLPAPYSTVFFTLPAKIQTSQFPSFPQQSGIRARWGAGRANVFACTPKTLLSTSSNRWSWPKFSSWCTSRSSLSQSN